VVRAAVRRVGRLEVELEAGSGIVVDPHGMYENFSVVAPGWRHADRSPSGGVARFAAIGASPRRSLLGSSGDLCACRSPRVSEARDFFFGRRETIGAL
jgi:hypothetical protein